MRIDILTLFPEMFDGLLEHSILGRAREAGYLDLNLVQWRDYALDKHRVVDDAPYGGGAGMVLKCEPLFRAIRDLKPEDATYPQTQVIYLTPQGSLFDQKTACQLAEEAEHLILVCGRYEDVDYRAREQLFDREISIGDYVLTGGELAAGIVTDAVVRLIPGVLGNDDSACHDSHMDGIFDHPHYTRPEVFEGMAVPPVLLSGHHANLTRWRREEALKNTLRVRPDLIKKAKLSREDRDFLKKVRSSEDH
ncbi:MAG: tRNA (guanosine(37)-N1)-methyltransferase TrmD [Candidatus Sumerlaeia bacterium]